MSDEPDGDELPLGTVIVVDNEPYVRDIGKTDAEWYYVSEGYYVYWDDVSSGEIVWVPKSD